MTSTVPMPLAQRLLKAQGKIESGQIANMRTHRITSDVIHTRLLGESRTLCGIPLRGHEERWAWQFIHRGTFGSSMPSGADDPRNGCQRCARSPVLRLTAEVVARRRHAWHEIGEIRV